MVLISVAEGPAAVEEVDFLAADVVLTGAGVEVLIVDLIADFDLLCRGLWQLRVSAFDRFRREPTHQNFGRLLVDVWRARSPNLQIGRRIVGISLP